ncbi:J domain-containing protein 1 [Nothophoma quercina]|uniref:J domain-containing protein 1 n=1 Tax=Nothophoma quercina TaxID=749835 RepID=A0ABR3QS06_9PLEO
MLPKKSPILLSSYGHAFTPLYSTHIPPPHSCRHTSPASHTTPRRTYATHASENEADLLSWPEPIRPHTTPTPYQILNCKKGDAYKKTRYYALVKLYHPDRCHPGSSTYTLPLAVRLERYRMLVAAHDILSDTEKRKAYDAWGAGWAGHHHAPGSSSSTRHAYDWEYDRKRWASDPRANATWEDWERWYGENDPEHQGKERAIQMSNFTFMSLLFAFVTIGGVMQGTRFSGFHNSVVERRDQVHREASSVYQRSRHATMSGDRDERIRTFLEHREANLAGEESYHRLLPPSENCAPNEVRRS